VIEALKKIIRKNIFPDKVKEKPSEEAYDLWSEDYDFQDGNLMLDMDEILFSGLLSDIDLENKKVADIGCGTGRHWAKMLQYNPASLTGFDVSAGMLNRLQEKFPEAYTRKITDNRFAAIPDNRYHVIVSTLTIAHIENIEEALMAWSRILKQQGDIIITDFHPNALAKGGKRTFEHHKTKMAVRNFVHFLEDIEAILIKEGFYVVNKKECIIDESVRYYYVWKNALPVYERFKNSKIIYGLHVRRD